jgi:hypothetical protein
VFPKLCLLIVCVGIIGGVLLTTRQLRIQAAHELADVQQRVAQHDRQLWQLRVEIADRTLPAQVAVRIKGLGPVAPIGIERYQELVRREVEGMIDGQAEAMASGDGEPGLARGANAAGKRAAKQHQKKMALAN